MPTNWLKNWITFFNLNAKENEEFSIKGGAECTKNLLKFTVFNEKTLILLAFLKGSILHWEEVSTEFSKIHRGFEIRDFWRCFAKVAHNRLRNSEPSHHYLAKKALISYSSGLLKVQKLHKRYFVQSKLCHFLYQNSSFSFAFKLKNVIQFFNQFVGMNSEWTHWLNTLHSIQIPLKNSRLKLFQSPLILTQPYKKKNK